MRCSLPHSMLSCTGYHAGVPEAQAAAALQRAMHELATAGERLGQGHVSQIGTRTSTDARSWLVGWPALLCMQAQHEGKLSMLSALHPCGRVSFSGPLHWRYIGAPVS